VSVQDPSLVPLARVELERQARLGRGKTGLKFVGGELLSLYAGASHKLDQAKALALAVSNKAGVPEHKFLSMGTRDGYAWCSDEGLSVLEPLIAKARGWVTLAQPMAKITEPMLLEGLFRLRAVAKRAQAFVMLFVVSNSKESALRLEDFCDELLVVERCEPDPGNHTAFSVNAVGLSDLHELGVGKSMYSVKLIEGRYSVSSATFIATTAVDRVIWKLRCQDKSLAEIGKLVGLDKSNVHRRLLHLRPVKRLELSEDWLLEYADLIDLSVTPPASKEPVLEDED
jgi:hypothetical protein